MNRKNKKKKSLGYIIVRMVLSTLTKEEYNEARMRDLLFWDIGHLQSFLCISFIYSLTFSSKTWKGRVLKKSV